MSTKSKAANVTRIDEAAKQSAIDERTEAIKSVLAHKGEGSLRELLAQALGMHCDANADLAQEALEDLADECTVLAWCENPDNHGATYLMPDLLSHRIWRIGEKARAAAKLARLIELVDESK